MTGTPYLGGQVIHQSLPVLLPGESSAPERKRLVLPQGDLVQLHNSSEPLHYLAWIELKAGGVRGHHVHRVKREFFYLLSGAVHLVLEDSVTQARVSLELAAGDLVLIEPGIAHAIYSSVAGQAIEFAPKALDPADTLRYPLTEGRTADQSTSVGSAPRLPLKD